MSKTDEFRICKQPPLPEFVNEEEQAIAERRVEIYRYLFHVWEDAREYALQFEVFTSTIMYMEENPGCTVEEATSFGWNEWIK